MVGENDARALTQADVGFAIGAGTDVAMESADMVLMKSNPFDVVGAIELSHATLGKIHQNLWWAVGYNVAVPCFARAEHRRPCHSRKLGARRDQCSDVEADQ